MNQNQTTFQSQMKDNTPGPVEQAMNKRYLDWTSATSGDKPLEVDKLPGMSPYVQMYQRAAAGQRSERTGLGSLQMGAANADPNLATNQRLQDKMRREQDAAGEIEGAYGAENAAVTGTGMPLVGADIQQKGENLNAATGMASSSLGDWSRFQIRPGFWQQAAMEGIRGAAGVASSYYSGGAKAAAGG